MHAPVRRFAAWSLALALATAAAGALTLRSALGSSLWHYTLALVVTAALAIPFWSILRQRRAVSLLMLYAAILATGTGFAMLYTREFAYKEWITWWHSATSFAFTGLFLAHWALNHARLGDFTRRLARMRVGWAAAATWVLLLGAGAWTWTPVGSAAFTRESYLRLASWAVLVGVTFSYGLWLAFRLPALRERLRSTDARRRSRALVDTSMWLACWLMLATGFLLLYLEGWLRATETRYVGKWWHTATSAAFLALVALHIGFNARLVAAHARRVDAELAQA